MEMYGIVKTCSKHSKRLHISILISEMTLVVVSLSECKMSTGIRMYCVFLNEHAGCLGRDW